MEPLFRLLSSFCHKRFDGIAVALLLFLSMQSKSLSVGQHRALTLRDSTVNSDTNLIISGRLLNYHTNLPVAKMEIEITGLSLKNTSFKCVTDAHGRFRFQLPDSLTSKDVLLGPTLKTSELLHKKHSEIPPLQLTIDDFPFKKNVVLYKYNASDLPKPVVTAKLMTQLTKQAEFPGGKEALLKFLGKNIQYPQMERDNNIQGIVSVRFMVDENGDIKDVKVIKRTSPGLDKEAMRVVKMMPSWQPAMYFYKPVRVYYTAPVEFKIQ